MDLEAAKKVAAEAGVEVANLNSPEQTVLSGAVEGIARAEGVAKQAGAKKAIKLNVAGAFHSSLMASAAAKLKETVDAVPFSEPRMTVFSNVSGQPHAGVDAIRKAMVEQVTSSVQWVACVQGMKALGVTAYVECGPGKVLTGLVRRIDKEAAIHNISDLPTLEGVVSAGAV